MITKKILWGPTMKLFLNTAVLCAIPKLVNAAEKKLQELITPDTPDITQLERDAKIAAENLEAAKYDRERFTFPNWEREPDAYDEQGNLLDIESPYTEVDTKQEFDLLNDQDMAHELIQERPNERARVVHGNGSRIHEADMANNYKKNPPAEHPRYTKQKGFTKCMLPITKEVHDKINEIWRWMQDENKRLPQGSRHKKYITDDAAISTNEYFGNTWGISTLTKCIRRPGCKTRLERDDCLSQAEVDALANGEVIRSVSEFSKMDKLNIKTKKEET